MTENANPFSNGLNAPVLVGRNSIFKGVNKLAKTDYMLGLKVGNTSVGFAAVDRNYQIVRKHGKAIWGVRLFDEAQTAEKRGVARMARRSNYRRKATSKAIDGCVPRCVG